MSRRGIQQAGLLPFPSAVCKFLHNRRYVKEENFMNKLRTFTTLAALALAASAALPALAETAVTVERGKHHYVFYSDKDIYYAPETKMYYWQDNGRWVSGLTLPRESEDYVVRAKGIDIDLDTERPYERNDYVVSHYRGVASGPTTETTTTERSMNADGSTTTTTTTTKRHYVYYGDHDIYFAPESRTYYWQDNGRWISGTTLPPAYAPYVRSGGVEIELDTDRPYERNAYVIAHYGHGHRHDRDDRRHDRDDD
jgi:hypothetical protein